MGEVLPRVSQLRLRNLPLKRGVSVSERGGLFRSPSNPTLTHPNSHAPRMMPMITIHAHRHDTTLAMRRHAGGRES